MKACTCSECGEGIDRESGDGVYGSPRGYLCGACATQLYPESMRLLRPSPLYGMTYPVELGEVTT